MFFRMRTLNKTLNENYFLKKRKTFRLCNDIIFGSYKINPSLLARCLAGNSRRVCIFLAYWSRSDAARVMVDRTLP